MQLNLESWTLDALCLLLLATPLGCADETTAAIPSTSPAAVSAAAERMTQSQQPAGENEEAETPRAPAAKQPSSTAAMNISIEQVVDPFAERKFWPPTPETAEKHFQLLGPLTRRQLIPEALEVSGGRAGPVERSSISFSKDGEEWAFVGGSVFLRGSDLKALQASLVARLRERLGKPKWHRSRTVGTFATYGWSVGRDLELLLAPSSVADEQLIMIMVSAPSGP